MKIKYDMSDALNRRQEVMTNIKRYIFNKRQQHSTYVNIREYLWADRIANKPRIYQTLWQSEAK